MKVYIIFQEGKYLSAHQTNESATKSVQELDKHFFGVIEFTIQEVELINN